MAFCHSDIAVGNITALVRHDRTFTERAIIQCMSRKSERIEEFFVPFFKGHNSDRFKTLLLVSSGKFKSMLILFKIERVTC